MRIYRVPAAYSAELEARISRAVDEINIDAYRRANGESPIIPDFALDARESPDGIVAIETVAVLATPNDSLPEVVRRVTEAVRPHRARRPA